MIDHFEIKVRNLQVSKDFYTSFLAPLGYKLAYRSPSLLSFVAANSPHPGGDFWLGKGEQSPIHFAFFAENHEQVRTCYEAGLKAGGKDNGAPDYRSDHLPYYAAFVLDPDGNNVEVVCHKE